MTLAGDRSRAASAWAGRLGRAVAVLALAAGLVGGLDVLDTPRSAALAVILASAAFVGLLRRVQARMRENELWRRGVEGALHASEQRFRSMFDALPDAVVVSDCEGRILSWNSGATRIFGYRPEEVLDRPVALLEPAGQRAGPGWPFADAGRHEPAQHDTARGLVGRRKDGSEFPHELSHATWEAHGELFHGAIIRDVSERRRAEQEHARLSQAVEQSAEAVLITDQEANIIYVNPAFEHVTGYTRDEVLGRNPRLLKSGRHDAAFYAQMWAVLTRGETWRGRVVNRRKDGSVFEEETAISPVRDEQGRVVNYVAVKRDVSAESNLQRQLAQAQRIEGIGRLAGGVAHDFNNLLGVILGYTDLLLRQTGPDDPARHKLRQVHAAGERGAALTRQLLAFSRKQVLDLRVLDLNQVVSEFTKMLGRLLGEDIALRLRLAPGLGRVRADAGQLEQVLMNLAVNARDAMPEGGSLTIETANAAVDRERASEHAPMPAGRYVRLAVSDTGCGMDEETRSHLFEPFFTTKPPGQGTGLGLATVYGVVKQTGGYVWAHSEPGRGTTFEIYLPPVDEDVAAPPRPEPEVVHRGRATVLVVEDDAMLRELTVESLCSAGYHVLEADGPDAALSVAASYPGSIELLLSDVVMPGGGGVKLAERLRQARAGLVVIFMSGYTDEAIARNGVLAPGVNLLAKPFTLESLTRAVQAALGG